MVLNELFNLRSTLNLDHRFLGLVGILLFLSLILLILAFKRLLQGKLLTASIQSLSGLTLCLSGLLFLSAALNLVSYHRLTYEQPIAELKFKQLKTQLFEAEISYPDQSNNELFLIRGDEWQIDARLIKWHGWAQILGFNTQFRLERISGRYSDIEEELEKPRTVYALGPRDKIDYWKLIRKYKKWLIGIDAYYGSATYLPMINNASYSVLLTPSGLIARPLDMKTEEKIKSW
jgi:hypothetical protein